MNNASHNCHINSTDIALQNALQCASSGCENACWNRSMHSRAKRRAHTLTKKGNNYSVLHSTYLLLLLR